MLEFIRPELLVTLQTFLYPDKMSPRQSGPELLIPHRKGDGFHDAAERKDGQEIGIGKSNLFLANGLSFNIY